MGKTELANEMTQKPLLEQITELLNAKGIKYKKYEHEPVFNSEAAAKAIGVKLAEGAKALILLGDGKPLMVVVSGADRVDFKKIKKLLRIRDLQLASPEQVKAISGVEIGAVPPFGNLFDVPLYADTKLEAEREIVFSAGTHTVSIQMTYSDFKDISKPIIGDFAKPDEQ
jgi:Ala-tRNA(Pro) deacylase